MWHSELKKKKKVRLSESFFSLKKYPKFQKAVEKRRSRIKSLVIFQEKNPNILLVINSVC